MQFQAIVTIIALALGVNATAISQRQTDPLQYLIRLWDQNFTDPQNCTSDVQLSYWWPAGAPCGGTFDTVPQTHASLERPTDGRPPARLILYGTGCSEDDIVGIVGYDTCFGPVNFYSARVELI